MSLKGDKYESQEEIRFRLESSVVTYDGKPVYISKVRVPEAEDGKEIARVYFYELPLLDGGNRKEVRKFLSSRKFDLSPFKMGYMNYKKRALYLARKPVRQQRQGLTHDTLMITDPLGKRVPDLGMAQVIGQKGFTDMVEGKYPTFEEAGAMLGDENMASVAISRKFAFIIDHDLEAVYLTHKSVRCGIAFKQDKGIKIAPKFHFLREELEECRIPLA